MFRWMNDLLAADFTEVFRKFPTAQPPQDWNVGDVKTEVGKRLAHLTAHRWRETRPDMDFYDRCVPAVSSLISAFRDALPPELQSRLDDEIGKLGLSLRPVESIPTMEYLP